MSRGNSRPLSNQDLTANVLTRTQSSPFVLKEKANLSFITNTTPRTGEYQTVPSRGNNEGATLGCLSGWAASWPKGGWATKIVRQGLSWPWITRPPLVTPRKSASVSQSVVPHISEMLEKKVIERTSGKVFLSRLFTVPKKGSDRTRLVMDLSSLNKYIEHVPFKMVTVAQVRTTLCRGDWLASIDLKDAYWHIPIHPRFRKFLAFQVGEVTFQFTRLPFGLSLAPRVFTKVTRVVANRLAEKGVASLMYLDDWLLYSHSKEQTAANVKTTLQVLEGMGWLLNFPKSKLNPTQTITWLGVKWSTLDATLTLAPDNAARTLRLLRGCSFSKTLSRHQCEQMLGTINFAATVLLLGRLSHSRLTLEVNKHFQKSPRDAQRPVPRTLLRLLKPWLRPGTLQKCVPWSNPAPSLLVSTDASDVGWGFQSNQGHQACGAWTKEQRLLSINYRELCVVQEWLLRTQIQQGTAVRFDMDNSTAVACIRRQGTSRSESLLSLSEDIFQLAQHLRIYLSARYVPGIENDWADALSRFRGTSFEWNLRPQVFASLVTRFGLPQIDLFASRKTAQLGDYLTYSHRTPAGGPDAFEEDWNRWDFIYLFPPPATTVLSKVIVKLRSFQGKALFIAPYWPAQPWFRELVEACPHPLLLGSACLTDNLASPLQTSLRLHAWTFSGKAFRDNSQERQWRQ